MTEILSTIRNPDSPWTEMQDTIERIARELAIERKEWRT